MNVYTDGLRHLADFLDARPEITIRGTIINSFIDLTALQAIARASSWEKVHSGSFFFLRKHFGPIELDVCTSRDQVCRRVVVGQRVVQAQPATLEHTEDLIEWVCNDSLFETSA